MTMDRRRLVLAAICVALVVGCSVLPSVALAIQPDAPFIESAKKNRQTWIAEDKQIDAKLAELHKKFGNKWAQIGMFSKSSRMPAAGPCGLADRVN